MRSANYATENSAPYPSCLVGRDTIILVYKISSREFIYLYSILGSSFGQSFNITFSSSPIDVVGDNC